MQVSLHITRREWETTDEGRGVEPLNSRTQGLVSQLSLLQESVATLLATPAAPRRPTSDVNPWATSRSTFVNWAASCKVDALGIVPDDEHSRDFEAVDNKISVAGNHVDAVVSPELTLFGELDEADVNGSRL